jgi:hypothetical protein
MKNLATKPLISRAIILLVLGLIVAQSFVVPWSALAAPKMTPKTMISKLPLGPSIQWFVFCWYFYIDEDDKTSQASDMQACQMQNTYFARVVTADNAQAMKWPVMRLDQLNLSGLTSADELQTKLQAVFKDKDVLSDSSVVPDLFDYVRSDAINDITKFDPDMKMAGSFPTSIPDAFTLFCQQEQTNKVITDTTDCESLATPFMDDTVLSMFTSSTNADSPAVTNAWLAGNSLQVLALKADSGVMEKDWMDALSTAVDQDSKLMTLMKNKDFMDDLWMWAPAPLLGANAG